MSDKSDGGCYAKRVATAPDWKRPAGPLNVWRTIEGEERNTGARLRFSIQQLPEARYEEAVTHMCDYFIADEATCKCLSTCGAPFWEGGVKGERGFFNPKRFLLPSQIDHQLFLTWFTYSTIPF